MSATCTLPGPGRARLDGFLTGTGFSPLSEHF
jgi:hypothetical protein